ncbi:hypothetical protein TCE0_060f18913 [Talaromyces pinophilus]|uniref:Uncharacterized protein n=1 Tax=Talaromyces pinophilus TaxID=128442 RepID=A0A6V8HQ46_TALPI|nr:hypothetical protein TCE0_060f18913 [Talaromyces pinophilus]
MAQSWARFCPNLNIPQYREPLSEEKKKELDQRADKLYKRAIGNQLYKSSEFSWEVSAWHDAFGLIMDDQGLRMDKRPYEFVEKDGTGQNVMKRRIPDATLGLKTYDEFDLKHGYECTVPDCKEDHSSKQPDKRLSKNRLRAMMHNRECGLVVDGVWGKTDLVFPFALYEAKKRASSFEAAEEQIYHACKTYLAMLDDLARNPDNVAEYQTEDSSRYQLFAFTSCGSYWQVYVAWNLLDRCHVETIWEGDVKEFSRAFDLICIVDQIHDYAVNNHRPFVMRHLEAWHARHEKSLEPVRSALRLDAAISEDSMSEDMESSDSDSDDENSDSSGQSYDFGVIASLMEFHSKLPEWFHLKESSKMTRQEKARQTRERNRKLRQSQDPNNRSPGKQRGRGRPAKAEVTKNEAPKRKRGRPPKTSSKSTKITKNSCIIRSSTRRQVNAT